MSTWFKNNKKVNSKTPEEIEKIKSDYMAKVSKNDNELLATCQTQINNFNTIDFPDKIVLILNSPWSDHEKQDVIGYINLKDLTPVFEAIICSRALRKNHLVHIDPQTGYIYQYYDFFYVRNEDREKLIPCETGSYFSYNTQVRIYKTKNNNYIYADSLYDDRFYLIDQKTFERNKDFVLDLVQLIQNMRAAKDYPNTSAKSIPHYKLEYRKLISFDNSPIQIEQTKILTDTLSENIQELFSALPEI